MSRGKKDGAGSGNFSIKHLFAETHRGILFDIIIFLVSVFLMHTLTGNFIGLAQAANEGDKVAGFAVFLFCLGIFILPPLGAVLKRPHFHYRLKLQGKTAPGGETFLTGCLFNPIFYFCLNVVIVSALNAFIIQFFYGGKDPGETVFVSMVIGGLVFVIIQTFLVYRFFSAPKKEPRSEFFRSPLSEILGDLCIFLNMILFQVMWGVFGRTELGKVAGVEDFLGRLFLICFLALLIYFPPRIFYLAEDLRRPAAWFTILLANSPMIVRILLGAS